MPDIGFSLRRHYGWQTESTFSAIKRKHGPSVVSRSETGMVNEVLCKILCHNLGCLIPSVHELGITATVWGEDEAEAEPESVAVAAPVEAGDWV